MHDPNFDPSADLGDRPFPLLTVPQACDLLGLSVSEFRRLRTTRRFPGVVRLPNGGLRVQAETLQTVDLGVAA
jgi:predicted DNA-binding transcriptional regulator AlpA